MAKRIKTRPVESLTHAGASRKNIPTAEYRAVMDQDDQTSILSAYKRRNRDLDPQLVWRGKDEQDQADLVVQVPPLYIQEKVHPKFLIDDLVQRSNRARDDSGTDGTDTQADLFADFNGISDDSARTEFYQHDANWSNRMILGDSLQVMASLAEREGLRGQVQCIYVDPPYGIKFNSNFQWSTTSRDVKDGRATHITREPEQVRAFRDTWRDGIHSYLTYLRDRVTVARDLLAKSGSIFVQIGDENIHLVRTVLDEVFGANNFVSLITIRKTGGLGSSGLTGVSDYVIWYARSRENLKYRRLFVDKKRSGTHAQYKYALLPRNDVFSVTKLPDSVADYRLFQPTSLHTMYAGVDSCLYPTFQCDGKVFSLPRNRQWSTTLPNMIRVSKAGRLYTAGRAPRFIRFLDDYPVTELNNLWTDVMGAQDVIYVVQTNSQVVQRCILMTTDPGDIVLDPTCGAGTTAHAAEQWGRRWITVDTSRVAIVLARARMMGSRYPYYLLMDSHEGRLKEASITGDVVTDTEYHRDVRQGFVYKRVPHVTLKAIAHNEAIDVIWRNFQRELEITLDRLNTLLDTDWKEWQVPSVTDSEWPPDAVKVHAHWWKMRTKRQNEIDASIAENADFEYLFDRPYEDRNKVRVTGPFTVESVAPHRVLALDENSEFVDCQIKSQIDYRPTQDYAAVILENLRTSGVQQAHKGDKISFTSIAPWPGDLISADGRYIEGEIDSGLEKCAAIMIGPEFGSVTRPDLVAAAREAAEGGFDVLVACAFNFEAHVSDFSRLGRVPILKARMNADLHMANDLRNTGKGNLFVIFGEPDIDVLPADEANPDKGRIRVRVNGVDVYHPSSGQIRSDNADGIACWFIDTDYNEESFFVRHAYFLGANDPYKSLKNSLKAEIDRDAWESLHSAISRPFERPTSGRIAVKVINHFGDEVMKIFRVDGSL